MIDEYVQKFNNYLPNGYVRVRQLSKKQQPAPIEVRVIGKDIAEQKKVAKEVNELLFELLKLPSDILSIPLT